MNLMGYPYEWTGCLILQPIWLMNHTIPLALSLLFQHHTSEGRHVNHPSSASAAAAAELTTGSEHQLELP